MSASFAAQSDTFSFIGKNDSLIERVETLANEGGAGAAAYLQGLRVEFITLNDAYARALQENPALLASQQDRKIAGHITQQNQAFFDPVLDLSLAYTHNGFNDRSEFITRERETLITSSNVPVQGGLLVPAVDDQGQLTGSSSTGSSICVTVAGELVNPDQCALQTEISTEQEFASVDVNSISAWSLDTGFTKEFAWGSQLELGITTTHREKNAYPLDDLGLIFPLSLDDPIGRGSRFPWTSTFGASFTTPLPFGKNFGEYGSTQSVIAKLAEIDELKSDWELGNTREQTLQQVDSAFWELLRAQGQLQVILTQLGSTEKLADSGKRLFDAQRITRYDLSQIDASLARIQSQEQLALAGLISASNRLIELLNYPENVLLLPDTQTLQITRLEAPDRAAIVSAVMSDNPSLRASREEISSAELLVRHREIQTRPDLSLSLGVNLTQSDRVLGYDTFEDSLSNVFDADTSDFFIGLTFVYPFGNHALKSRLSQARFQQKRSQLNLRLNELSAVQATDTVITRMVSTGSQSQHTQAALESAELAYEKAGSARKRDEISQFELLQKLDDLLFARTQHLNALIEHQKTRAQLLAVQGKLTATATGE